MRLLQDMRRIALRRRICTWAQLQRHTWGNYNHCSLCKGGCWTGLSRESRNTNARIFCYDGLWKKVAPAYTVTTRGASSQLCLARDHLNRVNEIHAWRRHWRGRKGRNFEKTKLKVREEEETGLEKEEWLMMAVVQHFEYQLLLTIIRKTESLLSRVWKGFTEAFSHSDVVFVCWTMAEDFDPKKRALIPRVNGRLKLRGCLPAEDKGNLVQTRGEGSWKKWLHWHFKEIWSLSGFI